MAVIKIVPMPGAVGDKGDEGAPGPQGPQGQQGLQGPAGADAMWSYNGAWQANAAYAIGDLVTYQGQLYYAKAITTAGTLPTDTSKFDLIAAKGTDGTNGTNGTNGADGATPFTLIGAYDNGAAYNLGIAVYYNGGTYVRTGNPLNPGYPPTLGAINESWTPIAEKGADFNSTNGLVVTGYIDDETINPSGTMSLGVLDGGYTALVDLVAEDATFNGSLYVSGFHPNRTTIIETPTTINNEVNIQTETGEGWTFNNDGYLLGPWLEDGRFLNVHGIVRGTGEPLLISSSDSVLINGTNGEFLNFHGDPNNQIATIGDLPTGVTGSFTIGNQTFNITNGIITSIDVNIQA